MPFGPNRPLLQLVVNGWFAIDVAKLMQFRR